MLVANRPCHFPVPAFLPGPVCRFPASRVSNSTIFSFVPSSALLLLFSALVFFVINILQSLFCKRGSMSSSQLESSEKI
jgi:hypothetical protein